ncbi:phospholipid transporter [Rhizodiscina lignyota]|uniref:Phospholipid transporter n=1 Tax=Rhizodiscina lignyota TaxID=1504668 RepID=A0A9P4I9J8_9PEZI|nr:phospholipid transporter [Rhizodiscina lignyota]
MAAALDKAIGAGHALVDPEFAERRGSITQTGKTTWDRLWPVIACGAGLFSDGYLNGVIGSVNTMLQRIYTTEYTNSPAQKNVSAITFAGTVVGHLLFGWTSDHYSRKWSLLVSTIILIIFAALCTGSYGAGGSVGGLFAALTAYRFILGIGIGGEYPAGSVGCAESTGELKEGTRHRWFILFTNVQIDFGFVVAAFVPMIVVLATSESHLRAAWRICLGLGVIPPLSLLYLRIKLQEPESFKRESMSHTKTPWWLVIKFYWFRLFVVSLVWFVYDFSAYSFGIYSSSILDNLLTGGDPNATYPLWKSFGWNTILNLWYMPGAIAGSFISDTRLGPKWTLIIFMALQSIVGYIMAACYGTLSKPEHVGSFVAVYGIFLALGEVGPGDNIGLCASKTSATGIRGQYYGIAAAWGKVGAFIGTYILPVIQDNAATKLQAGQNPFWVASSMAMFASFMALVGLPAIRQNTIEYEDIKFREYLMANGYDTSKMGLKRVDTEESEEVTNMHGIGMDGKDTDTGNGFHPPDKI